MPVPVPAFDAATGLGVAADRYGIHQKLFDSFTRYDGAISRMEIVNRLRESGLPADDPRIVDTLSAFEGRDGHHRGITFDRFVEIGQANGGLITRAIRGDLVIPEFHSFVDEIAELYESMLDDDRGKVADYIPQLGNVDPDQLAISLCTVDGQRFSIGQSQVGFCVQSVSKPINYCLALEEHGPDVVHRHVGREPSGRGFNELSFNNEGLPHNPMINSGAIMCCSLIQPGMDMAERFDYVSKAWQRLSGGRRVGFNNAVYLSERQTADRNFALGYSMRESRAFPTGTNLVDTLEFYFQCCSIEADADLVSVVAATLANGGVCPTTSGHLFSTSTVQRCLSLMSSCGMYDFSGEFAFEIGLPAKSGVSGALMIVVPKVMGICVWSPRLDRNGNSVRGIEFCRQLVSRYNFHVFDGLVGSENSGKRDPRLRRDESVITEVLRLCRAASIGDVDQVRSLVASGVDANIGERDGRTPLHVAASEGRYDVVSYLLEQGVDPNPVDRWGSTPMADAERAGHADIVALFRPRVVRWVGEVGDAPPPPTKRPRVQETIAGEGIRQLARQGRAVDRGVRKAFVYGYTNVLTQAWASDEFVQRLESQPEAVVASLGLPTVAGARVTIVRTHDAEPDLDAQVALWERGHTTGQYVLYVPHTPQINATELSDSDLESVTAEGGACCCNPCCCEDG
jgi:glutaminase